MKTIFLPADTEHLYLDEVAHLIADCLNPQGPHDPEGVRYKAALEALAPELEQAATSGTLRTRHPETLGPLPPVVLSIDPVDRLLDGTYSIPLRFRVVSVPDFAAYVADRGMAVVMEAPEQAAPAQSTAEPAPVADSASNAPDTSKGTPPKLTEANKTEILRLYNRGRGESVNAMAKQFSVSRPTIEKVLQRAGVKN